MSNDFPVLRGQADLVALKVDLRPSERREIAKTLAGVETELDETRPFFISNGCNGMQFVD